MAANPAADTPPIRIEPLSSAVGLWADGVDLQRLDAGAAAMIGDLWQLGGALLFRNQDRASETATKLAAVLAKGPTTLPALSNRGSLITEVWGMPGAGLPVTPRAMVIDAELARSPLEMAGMEVAAYALRMEDPELFEKCSALAVAPAAGGPPHPLIHRHALSGEACCYPPPQEAISVREIGALVDYVTQQRFCWRHDWQPGDILAVDPRAVRCRWTDSRSDRNSEIIVVSGTGGLTAVAADLVAAPEV